MTDELALQRQVCFALYAASRSVTNLYRPVLDELGLTYPQYLVLLVLGERGALPVKNLGTALRLDSGTLSPLLKRLETAGVISRTRRADDERSVLVELTPAGFALRERAREVPARIARLTGIPIGELIALRDDLHRLTAAVDAAINHTRIPANNHASTHANDKSETNHRRTNNSEGALHG
jgi:MarR family transcriptional regulator, organic hydroperoxide resistance regulator